MEPAPGTLPQPGWQRPRALARLCIASFIDQGFVFFVYLFGLLAAVMAQHMPLEELQAPIKDFYGPMMTEQQMATLYRFMEVFHEHGVALLCILLLRTVVRFFGTLRMWQGRRIGLHIYVSAQLLGVLLPMLIGGPELFQPMGFAFVLLWCYFYWAQRRALR